MHVQDLIPVEHDGVVHSLCCDASDLGLPPGSWPFFVTLFDGKSGEMVLATRQKPLYTEDEDRELAGYSYRVEGQPEIVVFND